MVGNRLSGRTRKTKKQRKHENHEVRQTILGSRCPLQKETFREREGEWSRAPSRLRLVQQQTELGNRMKKLQSVKVKTRATADSTW